MMILLVGGARSGKSRQAERWAAAHGGRVAYVATSCIEGDPEWDQRVRRHRARRPPEWLTIESTDPAEGLRGAKGRYDVAIVDCLTLLLFHWLGEHDHEGPDDRERERILRRAREQAEGLNALGADVIVVSNEAGMGIVPSTPVGRAFRDLLGEVNATFADIADRVYVQLAGQPLLLKPNPETSRDPWTGS